MKYDSCSPIIAISSYSVEPYGDGTDAPVCTTAADGFWPILYFVGSITVFFFLPFGILVLLYAAIAYKLLRPNNAFHRPTSPQPQAQAGGTTTATSQAPPSTKGNSHQQSNGMRKHRKQVIFMLVAVVSSFFVCLLPFRAFTLWVILASAEDVESLGIAGYYNLLYFSRFMLYLNSAMNPILYNLMSSKFRSGFWRLLLTCLGQRTHHHHHRHHHHQRQNPAAGGSGRNASRRQELEAEEGATLAGTSGARPPRRTLRREATFLINSISTSSGTDRTTSSSAWRSNSLSISGLSERERGILGAAIIGTTAATVTTACLQERRASKI